MNAVKSSHCSCTEVVGSDDPAASSSREAPDPDPDPDQPPDQPVDDEPARTAGVGVIEWVDRSGAAELDHHWIRERLGDALAFVPQRVERLDVTVVGDRQMAGLHLEHCGVNQTTDVLTFVSAGPPQPIEADIAVCVDEARRHARGPMAVQRELLLYCVHGLLHAAGYDDQAPETFAIMHSREDEILQAIGVGPVFRGGSSGHDDDPRQGHRDEGPAIR